MATQLKHADFALPTPTPRPNIRVAFSAGAATLAIRDKLADMPDAGKTLEEIALRSLTSDLLVTARKHLSPVMYAAFLRWGEESIRFTTLIDTDDELNAQAVRHDDALYALSQTAAETPSDLCLKAYVAAVEAHDRGGVVGPIDIANRPNWPFGGATLAVGFVADILAMSPITKQLNDIAARAWELSGFGSAWTREVGLPLAKLFADAAADVANSPEALAVADLTHGVIVMAHDLLSPPMFAAFLRWGEAASHYSTSCQTDEEGLRRSTATAEAIRALAALAMGNEHDHALKQYLLMIEATDSSCCGPLVVEDNGEAFNLNHLLRGLASDLVPPSPVTQSFDHLSRMAWEYSASTTAWTLPIGGAITAAFTAARRQLLDAAILDAFASRRREFEASFDRDIPHEEEAGYFARLDAAERVLCDTSASTIAGVIAKLRIAFMHQDGSAWADRAILDPTHPDFMAGLAAADMYTRLKWSAIEDLARIGGVNLAEQGR